MKTVSRATLVWVLLTSGLCMSLTAQENISASPDFSGVIKRIQQRVQSGDVPSCAVAVVKDGKIIWEQGFGLADRENNRKADEHTMYSLASISKPITATGIMKLVKDRKLTLDEDINKYLGRAKLENLVDGETPATVRQVLNHSSGLPIHAQFFYDHEEFKAPSFEESIRRYGKLMSNPGERYTYANFGYGILDFIIGRASRKSYADWMKREVFIPLGMNRTSVHLSDEYEQYAAVRYGEDGKPIPYYTFDHDGASAVYASAHDLARFALFHLGELLEDQVEIFGIQGTLEMQTPTQEIVSGSGYGMGWRITEDDFGIKTVRHTGGMPGVRTYLTILPDHNAAVVALCNSSSDLPGLVTQDAIAALVPLYQKNLIAWRLSSPDAPPAKEPMPDELLGYWRGKLKTYEGDRLIEIWVHEDQDVHVRIDEDLKMLVNYSDYDGDVFTGEFRAEMDTTDISRSPYTISMKLNLNDGMLQGFLTAVSRSSTDSAKNLPKYTRFLISHFCSLERVSKLAGSRKLNLNNSLQGWSVITDNDFEKHGEISIEEGVISLSSGKPATGIRYAGQDFPTMNYEVSLEARRTDGRDFFCGITFPVDNEFCSMIIGGWGGGVVGLSNIDNMAAVENESTGFLDVEDDRWYQIRLRVTTESIQAWIDGKEYFSVPTGNHKFGIWWEQEPVRPFGIASWYTSTQLKNIRISAPD